MALIEDDIRAVIDQLFCGGREGRPPTLKWGSTPSAIVEVVPDTLYEVSMDDVGTGLPMTLRLYFGLGPVGGQFWAQEVRALLRVSAERHDALPNLRDQGRESVCCPSENTHEVGYVVVDEPLSRLSGNDGRNIEVLRKNPMFAVRQTLALADALRLLHAARLSHRNLHPGTVELYSPPLEAGSGDHKLRLSGFEMSGFDANLLRRSLRSDDALAEAYRARILSEGRVALLCSPPERLELLFPEQDRRIPPQLAAGDVFGLGMLAFLWFVGDVPEADLETAFPTTGSGTLGWDRARYAEMLASIDKKIARSRDLHDLLRKLLRKMIRVDWRGRPTSWGIVNDLVESYSVLIGHYGIQDLGKPYLVTVYPEGFRQTPREWRFPIRNDPGTPDGLEQLRNFIQRDLRDGHLEWHPEGWTEIDLNSGDDGRRANVVLVGKQFAYFGHLFRYRLTLDEGDGVDLDQVIYIRWPLKLSARLGGRMRQSGRRRHLPPIEVESWRSREVSPNRARNRPSWQPLIDEVRGPERIRPGHRELEQALRWLVRFRHGELDARQYAFRKETTLRGGRDVMIAFDEARDQRRVWRSALLHAYADKNRVSFGDFFQSLESNVVRIRSGQERPDRGFDQAKLAEIQDVDQFRLRLRLQGGWSLPEEGWVEPADDAWARVQLSRQNAALSELVNRPELVEQLIRPWSMKTPGTDWSHAADEFEVAANGAGSPRRTVGKLIGARSKQVLGDMLSYEPFYALQGPPGTGKTTISARAVRAALRRDPSLRILVSAQSHQALDNLAMRIRQYTEGKILIRIASRFTEDRVDPAVEDLKSEEAGGKVMWAMKKRCAESMKGAGSPRIKKILGQLSSRLDDLRPEILDRVRRGANVVFATCAAATDDQVGTAADLGVYDWVIIEEAAKAWPTELAIPLVRANRWTLIGDHKQLGPYRMRETLRILEQLESSPEDELKEHAARRRTYKKIYELFGALFDEREKRRVLKAAREAGDTRLHDFPTNSLDHQFRMAPPISDLVSRAFYDRKLHADPSTRRPHDAALFGDHSLVWVDTSNELDHRCVPCWYNEGEVRVVAALVERLGIAKQLRGMSLGDQEEYVAVLTPYRQQVEELQKDLGETYRPLVHTVDSFQGREADVVIISLVRRAGGYAGRTALARVGHLGDAPRVNVMLSRARKLLVIVGDLQHFDALADLDDPTFWTEVCSAVREGGLVTSAKAIGG